MSLDSVEFSKLLHSIGSTTNIRSIASSIDNIKKKTAVLSAEDSVDDDVATLQTELHNVLMQLQEAIATIDRYERLLDKSLPNMLQMVETAIMDFTSATDATYEYNLEWFREVMLSASGKVELASKLFTAISRHTSSNLDLLQMIAAREPNIMEEIMSPYAAS